MVDPEGVHHHAAEGARAFNLRRNLIVGALLIVSFSLGIAVGVSGGLLSRAAKLVEQELEEPRYLPESTERMERAAMQHVVPEPRFSPQRPSRTTASDQAQAAELLPDWRMTTDCSTYGKDCVMHRLARHKYADYPFKLGKKFDHLYTWRNGLPDGWREALKKDTPPAGDIKARPPADTRVRKCAKAAQGTPVTEQLSTLLGELPPPHGNSSGLVSFTISDYSYARDMMHDVFEMAHNVVGLPRGAFFMVTIDAQTTELACEHGYPFLAWREEAEGGLKMGVAAAKFEISLALAARGFPHFFFEMDVWFVRSPLSAVLRHLSEVDVVFSGHQNNPEAANIGAYAFRANTATEEYLSLCVQLLKQSPEAHDQMIMSQIYWFLDQKERGDTMQFSPLFPKPPPPVPAITHKTTHARFSASEIAADEMPLPTEDTFAIHPLCGTPLNFPHGKKMVAKELGAWMGAGGYYSGGAGGGRYLWLDGHPWGAYSLTQHFPGYHPHVNYHSVIKFRWTIAASVALARHTRRVWVMPKVLGDMGPIFLWTLLDMQSLENLIEYRETNFPSNPRAWYWGKGGGKFGPVARSALGDEGRMYVQPSADNSTSKVLVWRTGAVAGAGAGSPFDMWFAAHSTIPELRAAQVLLAGMPTGETLLIQLAARVRGGGELSVAEGEIRDVMLQLRWCHLDMVDGWERTAGKTRAMWDCYGKGEKTDPTAV